MYAIYFLLHVLNTIIIYFLKFCFKVSTNMVCELGKTSPHPPTPHRLFFEMGFHFIIQAGFQLLVILLPLSPRGWDYRCAQSPARTWDSFLDEARTDQSSGSLRAMGRSKNNTTVWGQGHRAGQDRAWAGRARILTLVLGVWPWAGSPSPLASVFSPVKWGQ